MGLAAERQERPEPLQLMYFSDSSLYSKHLISEQAACGRFLWQPSYQAGQPETFLGRPVIEAIDMDDVGANKFPIAFGDFASAFRIYDRVSLSVMRDPYSVATKGLVRFHARRRVGGVVVLGEAIKTLKIATS